MYKCVHEFDAVQKGRLVEISVEGKITGDELADCVHTQEELKKISIAVETLQLRVKRYEYKEMSIGGRCMLTYQGTRYQGFTC